MALFILGRGVGGQGGPGIDWSFGREGGAIGEDSHKSSWAHGLEGALEQPDWPALTLAEVDAVVRGYAGLGGAEQLLSRSPRPFSAASLVATESGERALVKRHHKLVRDQAGLLEEHRLMAYLAEADWGGGKPVVAGPLEARNGATVVERGEWVYEVFAPAAGVDVYEEALSWTPFLGTGHARAAGRALGRLHGAVAGYDAPVRGQRQLVTSFTIFAGGEPGLVMEAYLAGRPRLRSYAEARHWQRDFAGLLMPLYADLAPWLGELTPLWTHNDFHASNLMWSGAGQEAEITGIIDFGLADRTNGVHDVTTAIERNCVEWLRMGEPGGLRLDHVHLDQVDALLAGYEDVRPLQYGERRALVAMLPLVHCEFALSETEYFLSVLDAEEKARLAYEGYFLGHAAWFCGAAGRGLLEHLQNWASGVKK